MGLALSRLAGPVLQGLLFNVTARHSVMLASVSVAVGGVHRVSFTRRPAAWSEFEDGIPDEVAQRMRDPRSPERPRRDPRVSEYHTDHADHNAQGNRVRLVPLEAPYFFAKKYSVVNGVPSSSSVKPFS